MAAFIVSNLTVTTLFLGDFFKRPFCGNKRVTRHSEVSGGRVPLGEFRRLEM